MPRAGATLLTPILGGVLGAIFFLVTLGPAIVRPTNLGWVMRHDTQTYLLSWHHFRREPWQWPPGKVLSVGHPVGTTIGNTDAIPILALPLKTLHRVLPDPAQYLGAWLLTCFILQGVFGALLVRLVTPDPIIQVLGAGLFVQTPALLHRNGHTALCAHWMLLAAIWLCMAHPLRAFRWRVVAWTLLCSAVALTQPYLGAMVVALAMADLASDGFEAWRSGRRWVGVVGSAAVVAAAMAASLWLAGYFVIGSSSDLGLGGLGDYSMNLLSPITPMGYSSLLPAIPTATPGQYEGLVYFGAGWLALTVAAAIGAARGVPLPRLRLGWLVVAGSIPYAVSPVVTAGSVVVADLSAWTPAILSVFRSSGRFGWLPMYVIFVAALATMVTRLPGRAAAAAVAAALALQTWDLHGAYADLRARAHDPAWTAWHDPLESQVWDLALPHYRHVVMARPDMCQSDAAAIAGPHLPFSLKAGSHGVTINSGFASRYDLGAVRRYCAEVEAGIRSGTVAEDSLYVLSPMLRDVLAASTRTPLACGALDGFGVCVTEASARPWRQAALAHGVALTSVPARR